MSQSNIAKGKIIKILPIISGVSKDKRSWRKKEIIIQLNGNYNNIICFSIWNNDIEKYKLELNDNVEISFDASSRLSKDKYYTDLKAWNIRKIDSNTRTIPSVPVPVTAPEQVNKPVYDKNESFDDLPF